MSSFRDNPRDPLGVRVGLALLALGLFLGIPALVVSHWFLVPAIPLVLIGGSGWAMEMSRAKKPSGEEAMGQEPDGAVPADGAGASPTI
ncbi:MAG: hypothetical protein NVSMB32_12910 [Actinomycetota bacterium]